ncbi:hypothetical protein VitviT2T_012985 [Vitis vinifera]|uniref:Disease resistance protein RGA3 n=1 Tax=Vitis vinifera TaxID=29760 RepID=A0ABY9CGG1_VITVI|nr:hypothetical protein VitviT2T_012985 [Vitis vinifera]
MDAIALLHPSQTLKKPVLLSDPLLALSSLLQSMAESFAFDLANKVLGKIASLALQEVALAWGVTADLDGLKDTLSVIQAVISDAEEQQSNSRQIADWLRKLKKALYEAEDVLDDFEYEALRRKVAKAGSITKQVHSFFSTSNPLPFSFKMGRKMKNLKERLDKIAADRSKFNLTERAVVVDTTHVVHRKREMTHSYVDVSNIIGREQDKENIVSILMKSSSDEQENVSVIPIIGIGGMGKTALAKLVYNDGRVVKHFDKRMWVCVSDEDNEIETLTKKILISATMGGTVHDLALSIKKIESKEVEDASITDNVPEQILALLQEKNNIRTIWFPYSEINATAEYVGTCSSRFKYMRVLDLRGTDFEELPSSIGNMKHLRYLDICGNKRVKKLPASICKLYLLLTLSFKECTELEELPRDMGNFISLRFLAITTKQRAWPRKGNGLACLISLRWLLIAECNHVEFMFEGLQNLTALRSLEIRRCPSLVSLPPSVKHLPALETLMIFNCEMFNFMDEDGDEENDIQGISCRLRSLMVVDLPKLEALPGWLIQGLAASTLHYLLIRRCHKFKALPESLENLTSLQELRIDDCPQLSTLSGGMHRLTTLKVLSIRDCPELSKRCKPEIGEDWHKIAHVPEIYIDGEAIKSTTNN